jgi:hypothetical protein
MILVLQEIISGPYFSQMNDSTFLYSSSLKSTWILSYYLGLVLLSGLFPSDFSDRYFV